jgi:hypothetical protein
MDWAYIKVVKKSGPNSCPSFIEVSENLLATRTIGSMIEKKKIQRPSLTLKQPRLPENSAYGSVLRRAALQRTRRPLGLT